MTNSISFLVRWLNGQRELSDAPASALVPAKRPKKFVTVERTGGGRNPFFDSPTVSIQCWDETQAKADALADLVADIIANRLQDATPIALVSVNSLYSFPLDEHSPRSQVDVSITFQPTK